MTDINDIITGNAVHNNRLSLVLALSISNNYLHLAKINIITRDIKAAK